MKKTLLIALGALCNTYASAQENLYQIADSIRSEGILLYQHLQICRTGVELLEADTTGRVQLQASGFLSYRDGNGYMLMMPHRASSNRPVITSYRFDSTLNAQTAHRHVGREMTTYEAEVWELWKMVTLMVQKDPGFKKVRDTYFMVVPMIEGESRKVYVLSAATRNNFFALGNDYLLHFNSAFELVSKQQFHTHNLMTPYGRKSSGHIHSESAPYISATDVCAFMLHPKAFAQESLKVYSPTFVSEWNFRDKTLDIIPRISQ